MFEIVEVGEAKFIYSFVPDIRTAAVGVFINAGARHEKKAVKGVAHFLEHMAFKGTKKYSYKKIKEEIEGRGGILNGFTSQEVTAYYSRSLRENLHKNTDILLDMVVNPLLRPEDIEKERNVIIEEARMHRDLPHIRVSDMVDHLLWERHPLGEEVIGTPSTIGSITQKQLREFKSKYYVPSRIVVSAVGNIDLNQIKNVVKDKLNRKGTLSVSPKKKVPSLSRFKVAVEKKQLAQVHLCIGFRGPSYRSRERFTVELLNVILGANMSSRLFEEIREKRGLCYDVSTEVKKYSDSGAFIIHLGLNTKDVARALKAILKELKRIKEERVSSREMQRAKDYLLGQMFMGWERPQGRMFYLAESFLTEGKILSLNRVEELISCISPVRLQRIAQRVFNFKKICISCVSGVNPREEEDKIINTLRKFF